MPAKDKDNSAPPAAPPKKKSAPQPERKTARVRATRLGFYGHMLRPVGTVFNISIAADEKWPSWVEEFSEGGAAEKADEPKSETSEEPKGSSSDDVL